MKAVDKCLADIDVLLILHFPLSTILFPPPKNSGDDDYTESTEENNALWLHSRSHFFRQPSFSVRIRLCPMNVNLDNVHMAFVGGRLAFSMSMSGQESTPMEKITSRSRKSKP